jgi:NitT/TauT family transport system permease protein
MTSTRTPTEVGTDPDRLREADWTAARIWRRSRYAVITIINLTVFFTLWELWARGIISPPLPELSRLIFPTFGEVMESFKIGWLGGGNLEGFNNRMLADFVIAKNFVETLKVYGISMLFSLGIGIPLGLLMGGVKWVDAILSPYVWTLSSLPRIAIYPILVMIIGIAGSWSFFGIFTLEDPIKYWVVVLTAIFPVIINVWAGVKTTDQSLINAAKVFGASRAQIYRKVVLPYTLPFVVTGVQLSLSRGLIGVVLAEFLTGARTLGGVGWLIFRAAAAFNAPLTYASLLSLAIFALVLVQGTRSMEARIAPWRQVTQT